MNNIMKKQQLSETDDLKYIFNKYLDTVKRCKPNRRIANQLKLSIDTIQVYYKSKELTNNSVQEFIPGNPSCAFIS